MDLVIIVLILYMVLVIAVSLKLKGKAETVEGFYLAKRSTPLPVLILTIAATWIGASSTLGKSGLAYRIGVTAMVPTLATFLAFSIFSLFAGKIQRIGANHHITSIPDLISRRFGRLPSSIASAVIAWTLIGTVGTQMVASAQILKFIFSDYGISYETSLIITTIVVIIYTSLSGFYGVVYSDAIQGILLLIVIGLFLPITAIQKAGGMATLMQSVPEGFFSLEIDNSIISYLFVYLLYFMSGPPYWQRAFAASDSGSAQRGSFGGNIIIILYSFSVTLVGICGAVLIPSFPSGVSDEMLIPVMVKEFFHPLLYALTITSFMAIVMSTIDSYLLLAAQTVSTDIARVIKPDISDKEQLKLSKYAVVILGILALFFALRAENILDSLVFSMSYFSACIAIPAMATLLSRKTTRTGILCGMIGGLTVAVVWKEILHTPYGLNEAIAGSAVSLIALIVGSILTQKETSVFLE